MINKYPKYQVYEKLYKRYFKRNVSELIDLAGVSKNDIVLDICGGNGRLTKELLNLSENVSYIDQEKDMIPEELNLMGVKIYNSSIQNFVESNSIKYSKVFCQQAINYWLLDIDIYKFSNIFEKDGTFIFNTFLNKPTHEPMIKKYVIDNITYIEISYLINNKVHHVQIMEGQEPHYTVFDWIDKETINRLLSPYFEIEIIGDKSTLIYKCKRY